MRSAAPYITAFWSILVLSGTFLVAAGKPALEIWTCLFIVGVFQAAAVRRGAA